MGNGREGGVGELVGFGVLGGRGLYLTYLELVLRWWLAYE